MSCGQFRHTLYSGLFWPFCICDWAFTELSLGRLKQTDSSLMSEENLSRKQSEKHYPAKKICN